MRIESQAFESNGTISQKYTKDGQNVSPPLQFSDVPAGTRQLALVLEDISSSRGAPFVHWLVYNIPANTEGLPEGIRHQREPEEVANGVRQGRNSMENVGYDGPAPALGSPHHYAFRLYALDEPVSADAGLDQHDLMERMKSHIIDEATVIASYERPR